MRIVTTHIAASEACPATLPISSLSPAGLVCDLQEGHESLHYDSADEVWWRPRDADQLGRTDQTPVITKADQKEREHWARHLQRVVE